MDAGQGAERAFSIVIGNAILIGDGVGKPLGLLNPNSGIQICDTAPGTAAGMFDWRDLIMLKWQIPMQYHGPDASYLMNQKTFALLLTMSDANGRPLLLPTPTALGEFVLNGSQIKIVVQLPDIAPDAMPILFGNWKQTYALVTRKAVTMIADPYNAGFCQLYKFEARIGGGILCPNAAAILRIR